MDQNGRQTEKPFVNTTDNNDDWCFFFFTSTMISCVKVLCRG